ncbi:MAG: hypothetical protein FD180_1017 [Planctomycetota bacterium]|nr:MAG: hypothetical protein FD180_1017 [Planctomycetota bacterium]
MFRGASQVEAFAAIEGPGRAGRLGSLAGPAGVNRKLARVGIGRVRDEADLFDGVQPDGSGRRAAGPALDGCEGEGVEPPAIAGELELVGRIAQERVAEDVGLLGEGTARIPGAQRGYSPAFRLSICARCSLPE